MNSIDSVGSALYFSAAASAARESQKEKDKTKVEKAKKSSFSSLVEKEQEISELSASGLPVEIAGLSEEKAVEYLQDQVDITADKLEEDFSADNFAAFRKSISQFLIYIQKNNFEVTKLKRPGKKVVRGLSPFFTEKRARDPLVQVHVVNEQLDKLAKMMLEKHESKLEMLGKVNEIKGLIVDFFAI